MRGNDANLLLLALGWCQGPSFFFVVVVVVFTAFVSSHIFSHINSLPHFLCLLFKVACIRCSLERKKAELTKNPPPVFHSTYHQPTKPDNTRSLTYIHIYWLTAWTNAQRLSPSDTPPASRTVYIQALILPIGR